MAIRFYCPHCDRELAAADEQAGQRTHCPHCARAIVVPAIDLATLRTPPLEPYIDATLPEQASAEEEGELPTRARLVRMARAVAAVVGLAAVFCALGWVVALRSYLESKEQYIQARVAEQLGAYQAAVEGWETLLSAYPKSPFCDIAREHLPGCYLAWAEQLQRRGAFADAAQVCQSVAQRFPNTSQARRAEQMVDELKRRAVERWAERGQYLPAADALLELLDTSPEQAQRIAPQLAARVLLGAAEELAQQRQAAEAVELLRELLQRYPRTPSAGRAREVMPARLLQWANALRDEGHVQLAERHYRAIIANYPQRPEAERAARALWNMLRRRVAVVVEVVALPNPERAPDVQRELSFIINNTLVPQGYELSYLDGWDDPQARRFVTFLRLTYSEEPGPLYRARGAQKGIGRSVVIRCVVSLFVRPDVREQKLTEKWTKTIVARTSPKLEFGVRIPLELALRLDAWNHFVEQFSKIKLGV